MPSVSVQILASLMRLVLFTSAVVLHMPWNTSEGKLLNNVRVYIHCAYKIIAIQRLYFPTEQQVVKGVTHCLLPECNQLVWPFKNYCGKSHADIGAQRGLARKSKR